MPSPTDRMGKNVIELFFALVSLVVFGTLFAFALWFGATMLVLFIISGALVALYVVLRGYYLNWKYGNSLGKSDIFRDTTTTTTIIDVEYNDVSNNHDKRD